MKTPSKFSSTITNEVFAACIQLPPNFSRFSGADEPQVLAALRDDGQPVHILGPGFAVHRAWSLIERICAERAPATVSGRLRVLGRRISPEAYLQSWRDALAGPLPIGLLPCQILPAVPVAVFEFADVSAVRARKAHWRGAPFATFGELADHCAEMLAPCSDGWVRLQVALNQPEGPRLAWWADDFLASCAPDREVRCRQIELRVPGGLDLPAPCPLSSAPAMAFAHVL